MCGRYALNLRPSEVRAYLENGNMPVYDAPADDGEEHAPRQSYNFAPGYHGVVYRADTPDWGAGSRSHKKGEEPAEDEVSEINEDENVEVRYKLQSMKWGLIPFWTKRNPDYGSMMKTINCRSDSLIDNTGMWTSMKNKKRCMVVCQGFYEWLKKGKEKVPHFVKRKDGMLMCFAGLWDCVQYDGEEDKHFTYTIITTDSNKQLKFLHDRMPVILENGSEELRRWLDPKQSTWTNDLQSLLKPFDGELEVYPVSKEVGKVGNNSPNFIVPVASTENKSNIANFFANGVKKAESKPTATKDATGSSTKPPNHKKEAKPADIKREEGEDRKTVDHNGSEDNAPIPIPKYESTQAIKRELDNASDDEPPRKLPKTNDSPAKAASPAKTPSQQARKTRSATSNNTASPKAAAGQDKKITSFFKK